MNLRAWSIFPHFLTYFSCSCMFIAITVGDSEEVSSHLSLDEDDKLSDSSSADENIDLGSIEAVSPELIDGNGMIRGSAISVEDLLCLRPLNNDDGKASSVGEDYDDEEDSIDEGREANVWLERDEVGVIFVDLQFHTFGMP